MPSLEKNLIDTCLDKINKTYQDFPVFIESGTWMGDTTRLASSLFEKVYTIEIDVPLYNRAEALFKEVSNTSVMYGDTIDILSTILRLEPRNSLFWLDCHNSGPGTSVGKIDFPVLQECSIIDKHFTGNLGLVLIDDVRLFGVGHSVQIDDSLITLTIDKILNTFENKEIIDYWLMPSVLDPTDRLVIYIK